MMTVEELRAHLATHFSTITFYSGTINKSASCVGIYLQNAPPNNAIGGFSNSSYSVLAVNLLVHWTEDYNVSAGIAYSIYDYVSALRDSFIGTTPARRRIATIEMQSSHPIGVGRDELNICELSIPCKIFYEREVT